MSNKATYKTLLTRELAHKLLAEHRAIALTQDDDGEVRVWQIPRLTYVNQGGYWCEGTGGQEGSSLGRDPALDSTVLGHFGLYSKHATTIHTLENTTRTGVNK